MKNTVKLEQFKEVTEAELQEIRGGDKRLPYFFKHLFVELTEVEMQEIQGGDMRISESIRNLIFPRKKK